jgi:hypothetical protein
MPKQQVPLTTLSDYLPDNCTEAVLYYLQLHKVHLTVTRKRQSILGDYRNAHQGNAHRISVNGNLNKYSFLVTLLHELAHLFTFEKYGHRVQPHGVEWKKAFGNILQEFITKKVFPEDVELALRKSLNNPAASSCGDMHLLRVLRNYDVNKPDQLTVEQLPFGQRFIIKDNRIFIKGEKQRTRYKCVEVVSNKVYLFNGLYEVKRYE